MIAFNIVIITGIVAYVCHLCWLAGVNEGMRRANRITQETWETANPGLRVQPPEVQAITVRGINDAYRPDDEPTRIQCRACRKDVRDCACPMAARRGRA